MPERHLVRGHGRIPTHLVPEIKRSDPRPAAAPRPEARPSVQPARQTHPAENPGALGSIRNEIAAEERKQQEAAKLREQTASQVPNDIQVLERKIQELQKTLDQRKIQELQQQLAKLQAEQKQSIIPIGFTEPLVSTYRNKKDLSPLSALETKLLPFKRTTADVAVVNNADGSQTRYVDRHQGRFLIFPTNTKPGVYKETYKRDVRGKWQLVGQRERIGDHIGTEYVDDPRNPSGEQLEYSYVKTQRTYDLAERIEDVANKLQRQAILQAESKKSSLDRALDVLELTKVGPMDMYLMRFQGKTLAPSVREGEDQVESNMLFSALQRDRMRHFSNPRLHEHPTYTKLSLSDRVNMIKEFTRRSFIPNGIKIWAQERGLQFFSSLGAASALFPWQGAWSLLKGAGTLDFIISLSRSQRLLKKILNPTDQFMKNELLDIARQHPDWTRNQLLHELVDRLYVDRNWSRVHKLEKRNPDLTREQVIGVLRNKDTRNTKLKFAAIGIPAAIFLIPPLTPVALSLPFVGPAVLAPIASVFNWHSIGLLVGGIFNGGIERSIVARVLPAALHSNIPFFSGLEGFLATAAISYGVLGLWRIVPGLFRTPARWRESRKVIEHEKAKKAQQAK